ncbi:MAG: sialidase family protein [Verrucomicrobia bacterium]|nr:sialidase family protein [Verrucomicrobiota bacterium]
MKSFTFRLLFWVGAFIGLLGPAAAQGTALGASLTALAKPTTGVVGLAPDGALVRSTDNGATFGTVRPADSPKALYAVAASGSTVIAMGDAGYFVRSTDNGATYSTLGSPSSPTIVGAVNSVGYGNGKWVAVGRNSGSTHALYSIDGGATWSTATISSPSSGEFKSVAWSGAPANVWVAVGGPVTTPAMMGVGFTGLYYTSNDGIVWSGPTTTNASLNAIASDGAGKLLAVGEAGTVWYSTATPPAFSEVGNGIVSETLGAVVYLSGTNWAATGDDGVQVNFDGSSTALRTIGLTVATASSQLQINLTGGFPGLQYHLETTTTLASWTTVSGSTQSYTGGAAPTWTAALPAAGAKVFYRAKLGSP